MQRLKGKVAWVTGAGTGIGTACAEALASEGATVIITGRRRPLLETVAKGIADKGGAVEVKAGDLTSADTVHRIVSEIEATHGRLDILVNNAGLNIPDRNWSRLKPEGIETLIAGNLTSAFLCVEAVLPLMRRQGDGMLIHTASWAGRFPSVVAGPAYVAAKHGVVAMSHTINMEECRNGIRSTAICPGEVATPIMDQRNPPPSGEDRARMLQPEDLGAMVVYVATQHPRVCVNEIVVSPTNNRSYLSALERPDVKARGI